MGSWWRLDCFCFFNLKLYMMHSRLKYFYINKTRNYRNCGNYSKTFKSLTTGRRPHTAIQLKWWWGLHRLCWKAKDSSYGCIHFCDPIHIILVFPKRCWISDIFQGLLKLFQTVTEDMTLERFGLILLRLKLVQMSIIR